jgi:dipeptidase E
MKLFLTSYRIPNLKVFCDFIGKPAEQIRFGLILNAKDHRDKNSRQLKAQELVTYFSEQGFLVEELDLRNYVSDNTDLLKKFLEFDVLWFNGGDTYCLREAIFKSGSELLITQAMSKGVVFAGDSAGAILAGPTLKYFDLVERPELTKNIIYSGLNLINFVVLPHWGSVEYGKGLEEIEIKLSKDQVKTVRLTDQEFLLIKDGQILNAN